MAEETIKTEVTELMGIKYPVILAGMNVAAGPELAAAVSNAGGLGVIGGVGYTPAFLKQQIERLKEGLKSPDLPFGVDLLLPQVGGSARKTNYDYTHGNLPELIDIIIQEKARLFVSAVGVPPRWAVERLHAAGIPIMNMIGAPKHAQKALEAGVDLICAQGSEGGGHTGEVATSILIPGVVDLCRGHTSELTGKPIPVVAAGGIYDGRGLAMALALGASAVWVGTRFVACEEAGAPPRHKYAVVNAGYHDTIRTIIFTGRPLRVLKNDYILDWEENRQKEIKELTEQGTIPVHHDHAEFEKAGTEITTAQRLQMLPLLMGQVAGAITEVKSAAAIINEMVTEAIAVLRGNTTLIHKTSKL